MNSQITSPEQAAQIISSISSTLELIPVNGKQNTAIMSGIYQALDALAQWASTIAVPAKPEYETEVRD